MAHHKQSAKRIRTNEKARQANKRDRSAMKTSIRKVVGADGPDAAKASFPDAMKKIDKAAKKRVIHPNAAARMKSRLARKLAKATTAQ
jgi:small subunit ribosomal protein S20